MEKIGRVNTAGKSREVMEENVIFSRMLYLSPPCLSFLTKLFIFFLIIKSAD